MFHISIGLHKVVKPILNQEIFALQVVAVLMVRSIEYPEPISNVHQEFLWDLIL